MNQRMSQELAKRKPKCMVKEKAIKERADEIY